MRKLVVAIDIDGVLLNFIQSISLFIEEKYGVKCAIDHCHEQWSLERRFDTDWIDSIGFGAIKDEFGKAGGWANIEMMRDAKKARDLLTNPMFDVHIVTMIEPVFRHDRKANLERLIGVEIPLEKLHCMPMTSSKKPTIDALKPDVFIEDSLTNINICAGAHASIWIDTTAYDQKTAPKRHSDEIISALHFDEAYAIVEQLAYKRNHLHLPRLLSEIKTTSAANTSYARAEALYHLLGGASGGYRPQRALYSKDGVSMTRWWLQSEAGAALDPSADPLSLSDRDPSYHQGQNAEFATPTPSKQAQEVISRLFQEPPTLALDGSGASALNAKPKAGR